MTKIDIFSGFLGAGKTTLIKKLIKEAFAGQQVVLIENEFACLQTLRLHRKLYRYAKGTIPEAPSQRDDFPGRGKMSP